MSKTINEALALIFIFFFLLVMFNNTTNTMNGEIQGLKTGNISNSKFNPTFLVSSDYPSHTDIPRTNFTGTYNITLFTNPDCADEVIFSYLKAAEISIYVSMYTISRSDFNDTLISLKANKSIDIQVLISKRRVGASENVDTAEIAQSLVDNLIPVYNSTTDDDKVNGYYHNKYWIIDGKHVFIYSGNWSPRSVTPQLEPGDDSYTSSEANRDMGIAVLDAPDIAQFFKDVWDADVAEADSWMPSQFDNKLKIGSKNSENLEKIKAKINSPLVYSPEFDVLNLKEEMTLSPMFTPDNALDIHKSWIDRANKSIIVQNQYITQFDDNVDWDDDPSPLVRSIVAAKQRGVQVKVQVNEESDSDNVTYYFLSKGIEVRWMGNSQSSSDENYLAATHNKLIIIDDNVTLLSSINFGENAFTNNREAGIVIQNTAASGYYKSIFESDWVDGEIPPTTSGITQTSFSNTDVVSGNTILSGQVSGLENTTVFYRWGSIGDYTNVTVVNGVFSVEFDSRTLENGITDFEVKAVTNITTYSDKVTVNIVNHAPYENWRLLITELLPNPDGLDAEKEYIELTNSFPFDLFIEDWQIGDDSHLYTFPSGYIIKAYTSIIIARDTDGFSSGYGKTAELELDISLNNGGDLVQLLDHNGNYMDVVTYGDETSPDNSEVLAAPESGESILRTQMHIDTNQASDFHFGSPDPKGSVPQAPLNTDPSGTSEETPFSWIFAIIALVLLPKNRRRPEK